MRSFCAARILVRPPINGLLLIFFIVHLKHILSEKPVINSIACHILVNQPGQIAPILLTDFLKSLAVVLAKRYYLVLCLSLPSCCHSLNSLPFLLTPPFP